MNNNKLNKSEVKILQCIKGQQPVPNKNGKYNIYFHRAVLSLMSRKLIHLCDINDRNTWCISDPERVEILLNDIAPVVAG